MQIRRFWMLIKRYFGGTASDCPSRAVDIEGFCSAFEQEKRQLGVENLRRVYDEKFTIRIIDGPSPN